MADRTGHPPSASVDLSRMGPREAVRLYVDLVPRTAWCANLRSLLSSGEWQACRRAAYARAGLRCEACGGRGERWPVEAHERWHYDYGETAAGRRVQRLADLVALCPACHEASHLGLAEVRGRGEQALAHLARVNGWSDAGARAHAAEAFRVWRARSAHPWLLDATSILAAFPGVAEERRAAILRAADGIPARGQSWDSLRRRH